MVFTQQQTMNVYWRFLDVGEDDGNTNRGGSDVLDLLCGMRRGEVEDRDRDRDGSVEDGSKGGYGNGNA